MPPLPIDTFIFWLLLLAVLLLYLFAALQTRASWQPWSLWRDSSFSLGIILLIVALSPPMMHWAHHDFRGHMVQHLILGMFAPLALTLAAPVTLTLRTLPTRAARALVGILRTKFFACISHPITTLFFNIGGMYLLYLTPIYLMSLSNLWLHYLVHLHFLLAGYLYVWSIAGPDATPARPSMRMRLGVLFVGIAAHSTLAKLMYIYLWPVHTLHSDIEIRSAAKLMYYGGDLAELLLAVALFMYWYESRNRRGYKEKSQNFISTG